ncbi:unnamed protein product [Trifolium pratense]|uniref:Uncharacterized protein n=1 Tax=Trifolium pratense TaxID=57577 RepID=A0ACB0L3L0_TRIPR|nr:unnamed protein product [Trifolium pratense]
MFLDLVARNVLKLWIWLALISWLSCWFVHIKEGRSPIGQERIYLFEAYIKRLKLLVILKIDCILLLFLNKKLYYFD